MKDGLSFLPTGTGSSAEPRSARTEPDPVRAKILIVDDDQRNLLAASEVLADPAIDLVLANSPEEALRQALREDFALILLDVQMPRMDGYEVASLIRSRSRTSRVPILFLTAHNKEDIHIFRGYSAGAVDYVFKPIQPLVLKSKVDVFVDLYLKTAEIQRKAAADIRPLSCVASPLRSTPRPSVETIDGFTSRMTASSASPASRARPLLPQTSGESSLSRMTGTGSLQI
jgi:CheY-like chemotaxis protein